MGKLGHWFVVLIVTAVLALQAERAASGESTEATDELLQRVTALEKAVTEHSAANANEDLVKDLEKAVALHEEAKGGEPCRGRVVKLFGIVIREKDEGVRKACIDAIQETRDEEAGKLLRPFLRPVEEILPKALNELTGQKAAGAEDWFALVKENKRDLGALFKDKDEKSKSPKE